MVFNILDFFEETFEPKRETHGFCITLQKAVESEDTLMQEAVESEDNKSRCVPYFCILRL
jgi:hypothetical protein